MTRGLATGLLVSLATVALFLLLLEGAVRLIIDDGMQYDLEMWKYARELKVRSEDSRLGHQHAANRSAKLMGVDVAINSLGLRNAEISQTKPASTQRILMLGDSLTFGWGVPQRQTTSWWVESLLNGDEEVPRYQVVNAGVGNYNTEMSVEYYRQNGHLLDPDLVVLNYFINDAEVTPRPPKLGSFLGWSAANAYFYGRFDAVARMLLGRESWSDYYRLLYREEAPGWQATRQSIEDLAEMTRAQGTPLLLVNYPELRNLATYPFTDVSAKIERVAAAHGVLFLDLLASVQELDPRDLWVSVEDPHPNGKANAHFAAAMTESIRQILSTS